MKKDAKISVRRIQFGALALLAFIAVFVWSVATSENRGHNLRMAFLDVEQGDAI